MVLGIHQIQCQGLNECASVTQSPTISNTITSPPRIRKSQNSGEDLALKENVQLRLAGLVSWDYPSELPNRNDSGFVRLACSKSP